MSNFYDLDPAPQQQRAFERLRRYLRDYVAPYHPFLRKHYRDAGVSASAVRTLEDFRRLPIIEKHHLRSDPRAFIVQPRQPGSAPAENGFATEPVRRATLLRYAAQSVLNRPRDYSTLVRSSSLRERMRRRGQLEWLPIHHHVSGGTTGDPVTVSYTAWDLDRVVREMASLAILHKHPKPGYLPFDFAERRLVLFPGAPHIAFYGAVLAKIFAASPSFETFGGAVIPTDRQLSMFVSGGFSTLVAIPSYLVHWLRRAGALRAQNTLAPLKSLRRVILAAEPVSETLREQLRLLAIEAGADPGLRITQMAGMTEMKWSFHECAERGGVHLNPKFYYWELLHPETRQPVGPGEPGVLVFTHIGWRGTVLVRYWTGDLVKGGLRWERCEHCGYTFPRIFPPICRAEKDFTKVKGALVDLPVLAETVRATPGVRLFQVTLDSEDPTIEFSRDVLVVHVFPEAGVADESLARVIRERVKEATEVTPDRIVFETDGEALERRLFSNRAMKAEYVIERRKHRL